MMGIDLQSTTPKILILATLSGGYAGADSVGQLHTDYAANVSILPTVCPAMFPEEFYLRTFEKGIDAILVMYSGTDCPYKGGAERTAEIINRVYPMMKERGHQPAATAPDGHLHRVHKTFFEGSREYEQAAA